VPDDGLLVGALTAVTALVASYLTARATSRAALTQARVAAAAEASREARERRRSTYREMLSRVHAFMEPLWRIRDADTAPDAAARRRALEEMAAELRPAMNQVTLATREVLLDGPAAVSDSADRVRQRCRGVQEGLRRLIEDGTPERRAEYDAAYRDLRDAHLDFIALARGALEAEPPGGS
jgi:hypothetical protein